jgi:hypothetical protein
MMMPCAVFGTMINERECGKRTIPIKKFWACSISDVKREDDVPYVCVCCSAPTLALEHLPVCDVQHDQYGWGVHEGFCWLRIDDFVQLFDLIWECRLVNPTGPGGHPAMSMLSRYIMPTSPKYMNHMIRTQEFHEQLWALQDLVTAETSPSFMIEVKDQIDMGPFSRVQGYPVEIVMEVSQTDHRFSQPHKIVYTKLTGAKIAHSRQVVREEQASLLLRFFQCSKEVDETRGGEVYMAHMSAWGHCRDAMCCVKVNHPGKYLAMVSMPARYECDRMLFRCYSRPFPVKVTPITGHRAFVTCVSNHPLHAIPYSLVGLPKIRDTNERLPEMFDEDEGKGRPLAGWKEGLKHVIHEHMHKHALQESKRGDGGIGDVHVKGPVGGDADAKVPDHEKDDDDAGACVLM